jgi:hypothetical protein
VEENVILSAATQDILTVKVGPEEEVLPAFDDATVAANTTIFGGTMVMVNSAGYAVPAAASPTGATGNVFGIAVRQAANTSAAGYGAAGAINVRVQRGAFYLNLNADSTVTIANNFQNVYASDDNTVSLSSAGGTRAYAGYLQIFPSTPGIPGLVNGTGATKVRVLVGQPPVSSMTAASNVQSTPGTARVAALSVAAYTGSGTGQLTITTAAVWAIDGVTVALGDQIFLPPGLTNLTAVDSGPWTITTLGTGSIQTVLSRPAWFDHGTKCYSGFTVKVGGEGAFFNNSEWRSTAAAVTIDTTDAAFYVGRLSFQRKLVAGTLVLAAGQPNASATSATMPVGILSATQSQVICELAIYSGSGATVSYGPANSSSTALCTPGYSGTAAGAIFALASAQTTQASDTSTIQVTVVNF